MTISYTRLDVPIDENGSIEETQANAAALIEELGDCNLVESRFSEFGPASGRYGPDPISVITLCNRAATDDPEAIANLERQVFNQRMNNYASSYIQELQADAIIVDR